MISKITPWFNLAYAPGISAKLALQLVRQLGEPATYTGPKADFTLATSLLTSAQKSTLKTGQRQFDLDKVAKVMDKLAIRLVTILDAEYPTALKQLFVPPLFLFVRGVSLTSLKQPRLAVVGTRKVSAYGRLMTEKLATDLAQAGFCLVSGLALGVDTLAHRAALKSQAPTLAVMGTGCEHIYPASNQKLGQDILSTGALISEFPPFSCYHPGNFPRRNRIISGLSQGVVVIEGTIKSGSMITARHALEQNRDIFALPGDVARPQAEGPNQLIVQGAVPVCSSQDILSYYQVQPELNFTQPEPDLTTAEQHVYDILLKNRPQMDLESLVLKSAQTPPWVAAVLMQLELKSLVKRLPGNKVAPLS